jgi:hypothetical protein
MIGGGAKVAASRYFSWDALLVDFGFGSAGGSRVIRLTDQSTRSTANYSLFLTSGWRVSAPLARGSSARIEASAGYAGVLHKEYGVGRYLGPNMVEQIACTSCFNTWGNGYYALV